jgi:DNA-binding NtrC family response regulator
MKIIVVDDEPVIADTLVNMLMGEGHDAFAVSNGKSAISLTKLMRPARPDLLVTDVIMPGMDGVETAKEMVKLVPTCRIILFSGQAASTDLVSKAEAEGYSFEILAKPINPTILLAAINRGQAKVTGSVAG